MSLLKDFVKAMSVAWPIALAICFSAAGILVASLLGVPFVVGLPDWAATALFVAAVFAASTALASLLQVSIAATKARLDRRNARVQTEAHERRMLSDLGDLPHTEHQVLADLLSRNMSAFPAPVNEERLVSLITKGIVLRPSGMHSPLTWPHFVHPAAWREMKAHPEKFAVRRPTIV